MAGRKPLVLLKEYIPHCKQTSSMFFWYSNVNPNTCYIQKLITAVIEPNYFKVKYSPSIKCDNVWISERVAVPCWEVSNCDLVKMKCVMNTVYTAVFLHYCSSQTLGADSWVKYKLQSDFWNMIADGDKIRFNFKQQSLIIANEGVQSVPVHLM